MSEYVLFFKELNIEYYLQLFENVIIFELLRIHYKGMLTKHILDMFTINISGKLHFLNCKKTF